MNIEEFCAEHPEYEEIESTRRCVRLVSGVYDDWGHATADATFCLSCGEEWDSAGFCCSNPDCEFGYCEDDGEP